MALLYRFFWNILSLDSYHCFDLLSYVRCCHVQVLEPCQASLVYQPPNPWTMAILGLLCEIYAMPNLKMNLKFDIEVRGFILNPERLFV